jgi:sugar lactone lactonase YvrE
MSDNRNGNSSTGTSNEDRMAGRSTGVASKYKVLGLLEAGDGVGVLGQNDARSGTPYGVEGAVPNNSAGYGLYTADDAKVGGVTELTTVAGGLTGGKNVSDIAGSGLAIDSGALTRTGTYATNTFTAGGTTWTPISGLSSETPVELTVDTNALSEGSVDVVVDGSRVTNIGAGGVLHRVVGPTDSLTLESVSGFTLQESVTISGTYGIGFKGDGTKLYGVDASGADVYSYSLSTAWDVSTASSLGSVSVYSQDQYPYGIAFKSDGTKMFVSGTEHVNVYSYELSTAWDISTASFLRSFDVSSEEGDPDALAFKDDGSRMFVSGNGSAKVHEYSLSSAWDLSTASYTGDTLDAASETSYPGEVAFQGSGSKLYLLGDDVIYEYALSTAWDITTASYTGTAYDVSSEDEAANGLAVKPDDSLIYMSGFFEDKVHQYTNGSPFSGTAYATVQRE